MYEKKINLSATRLFSLFAIFASFILIYNLLTLHHYPPGEYNIDIYSQLPIFFWTGVIFVYFISCALILQQDKTLKIIGSVCIIVNFCVIYLILPELGSYVYGPSDELTHIGRMNFYLLDGYIDHTDIYPATTILYLSTSIFTGLGNREISFILPAFVNLLFITGTIAFSNKIINFPHHIFYIFIPCSFILYFGHFHFSNVPQYTYFTLIPLILYILFSYLTQKNFSKSIVLVIFLLITPFSHPFNWMFMILTLLSIFIYYIFSSGANQNILNTLLLGFVSFITWFLYSSLFNSFEKIFSLFLSGSNNNMVAEKTLEQFGKINLNLIEIIQFFLFYTGRYLIPFTLVIIFLLCFFKGKYNIPPKQYKNVLKLMGFFLLFTAIHSLLFFNNIISHSTDRISNLVYGIFALIPLFALSLNYLFSYDQKWASTLKVSIILTLVFSLSLFGVFYSPYIYRPNSVITESEVTGMEWLFDYKNESPIYAIIGAHGYRYATYFMAPNEQRDRMGKDILWSDMANIPDHFGYNNRNSLEMYDSQYIPIPTRHELLYQTVYSSVGRFNKDDFAKFREDLNIIKMYDSSDIEIYKS